MTFPGEPVEKRSQPRYPVGSSVEVCWLTEPPVRFSGQLSNLSANGLRLLVERELPPGAPVQVSLEDLILLGEVRYCRPAGGLYAVGLELEHCLTLTAELLRLAHQLANGGNQAGGALGDAAHAVDHGGHQHRDQSPEQH